MIDHKITAGLSIVYEKKEWRVKSFESSPAIDGLLEFLVSTPGIIGMILEASNKLLAPLIPEGYITIGKELYLNHEEPTLIDEVVSLEITVTKVYENFVYMDIVGTDPHGSICKGNCVRAIVMPNILLDHAYERAEKKPE
ncbi:MAG: hypothetical protein PHQ50_04030 [Eubacteriales bacterium]|nr:hypothetical protein [Eubacteriales bacterium]MDD3350311.1 hypothetical protein [Eubacteriales bacterium]